MNLTKGQRFEIIPKLTEKVINMGETKGFFFLKEYTEDNDSLYEMEHTDWGDVRRSGHISFSEKNILEFIQNLDNEIIYEMYKDQFPEEAEEIDFLEEENPLYHLSTDKLVLFFSHSYKDLDKIIPVKNILEKTDWIECFIAHKSIKLSKKWEKEIKKYLECCHGLIAFLSKDFKSSNYCDQEMGMAVHREIPIFQFTLDNTSPYGFIRHLQAKPFKNPEDSVHQIEEYIFDPQEILYHISRPKLQKTVKKLTNNFLSSSNTQMAGSVLDQLMEFKTKQIDAHFISEIQKYWGQNSKIKEVQNIEKKMEEFFKKHPPQPTDQNEKNSHQETSLETREQSEIEKINLKKEQEKDKDFDIPF